MTTSHTDLQLQLTVGIGLDAGQSRRSEPNEDSLGIYSDYCEDAAWLAAKGRLFVVADGMGGASGGKEASQMAVQTVLDTYYDDPDVEIAPSMERAIREANARIREHGQTALGLRGLGTTIVAVVIRDRDLVVANVGDSRAYLLRQGALRQLSLDHTTVQEHVRDGLLTPEEAATHPRRHVLSRNLGSRLRVQPAIATETLVEGDTLLLCSDGLWGPVGDEKIGELLRQRGQATASALVELANELGGPTILARSSSRPMRRRRQRSRARQRWARPKYAIPCPSEPPSLYAHRRARDRLGRYGGGPRSVPEQSSCCSPCSSAAMHFSPRVHGWRPARPARMQRGQPSRV